MVTQSESAPACGSMTRYGKAGFEQHHRPAGSVMTVAFELDGESFLAYDGGA